MDPSADELAGVADLFGGLSLDEFERAFENLAARQGEPFDAEEVAAKVRTATDAYFLVEVDGDRGPIYAPGPAALPRLPDHGDDLPHMMDLEPRSIDRAMVGRAVEERLRADAAAAVADGDRDRMQKLLDVAYEVDAWGVDTTELRDRLSEAIE